MMNSLAPYRELLLRCSIFTGLSGDEIDALLSAAEPAVISRKKGEMLFLPSELRSVYLVLTGQINVLQDSGMTVSLAHALMPGDCFGVAFCAGDIPCRCVLQAAEHSRLLQLSYRGLLEGGHKDVLMNNLLHMMAARMLVLAEKINHTQSRSVRVTLSQFLRDQSRHSGTLEFELGMRRKDLAEYLTVSYPAMLRELSQMQKEGLITLDGERVRILDMETLTEQGAEYSLL